MARALPGLLLALIALSVSGAVGTTTAQPRQASGESPARQAALGSYGALPLAFVPNAGQLDRRVRFSAQAGNATVFLMRRAAILSLAGEKQGAALRLIFDGANLDATVTGADRSAGRVNYLTGNDRSRWRTNLPTYAEVVYHDLWPGIDLGVGGGGGQLKYEFRLAPGADPANIRLRYHGQERLSLDRDGALRVETALGLLRDGRPLSYQPVGGRRVAVESRFTLGEGGAYGFALGAYDRRNKLVIDPGLVYSTYLGGSRREDAGAIAVDHAGNAYLTGTTNSTDFPTTAGAFDRTYDVDNVFVTKLNPAGSRLVYSTYLGGKGRDEADGIAVDWAGSAYVTGYTGSTTFPTTAGAYDRSYNGADAFVTKLSPAGSTLAYSTYLGGKNREWVGGIAVDRAGNAYLTGSTTSRNFPTSAGALDRRFAGDAEYFRGDAFVTKLNPSGSALVYSTFLGGSESDGGGDIAIDSMGSAYVMGGTESRNFPTTAGAFDRSFNGGYGALFVTKLNAAGSALAYSTYLGGRGIDEGAGIAVDLAGSAYVTGSTESRNFPTNAGAFDRSFNAGYDDAFVTKLNAAGSALAYSTYLGSRGIDKGAGIAVDRAGNAYVTGSTGSKNFPVTAGAFDKSYNSDEYGSDAFVTKLNAAGSALAYSTYLGGSGGDSGQGIAVDRAGSAYVTGTTSAWRAGPGWPSRDFPTTAGAFDRSLHRGRDAFVAKLTPVGPPLAPPPNPVAPPVMPSPSAGFSIGVWEAVGALLVVGALAALVAFSYRRWFRVRLVPGRR